MRVKQDATYITNKGTFKETSPPTASNVLDGTAVQNFYDTILVHTEKKIQ